MSTRFKRIAAIIILVLSALMLIAICATPAHAQTQKIYDIPVDGSIQMQVCDICELNGVDPAMIFAISKVETRYQQDHYAGSCKGIMQVNVSVHSKVITEMGLDYTDIYDNYVIGLYVYKLCLDEYGGNTNHALMAYNGGTSYANGMIQRGVVSTRYTKDVLEEYNRLKASIVQPAQVYGIYE